VAIATRKSYSRSRELDRRTLYCFLKSGGSSNRRWWKKKMFKEIARVMTQIVNDANMTIKGGVVD